MKQSSRWPSAIRAWALPPLFILTALTIWPGQSIARTWHVPADAPTIQAGIDSAAAGDDVLVAPGTYPEHDIVMKAGVWVHSEHGPETTTVDAGSAGRGFDSASLQENATLEGFRIVRGHVEGGDLGDGTGGGLRCHSSQLTVRNCIIEECSATASGGGIFVQNSAIRIEGCTIRDCTAYQGGGIWAPVGNRLTMTDTAVTDNETMGMWASGPEVIVLRCIFARNVAGFGNPAGLLAFSPALTIEDCLIADHRNVFWGGIIGLAVWSSSGSVSGCTVVGNALAGESAAVSVIDSNVTVDRCIVAFNEGVALECSGAVSVRCCDLYGNATGNDLCGEDLGGNFSADPLFCDMENWDYSLDAQSPCLPGNHPDEVDCGLIGARGQGCGGTPVQEATWGRLKLLYRGR